MKRCCLTLIAAAAGALAACSQEPATDNGAANEAGFGNEAGAGNDLANAFAPEPLENGAQPVSQEPAARPEPVADMTAPAPAEAPAARPRRSEPETPAPRRQAPPPPPKAEEPEADPHAGHDMANMGHMTGN